MHGSCRGRRQIRFGAITALASRSGYLPAPTYGDNVPQPGRVPKWTKGTDCKSVIRRFESDLGLASNRGVTVFLVISGFCLMLPVLRTELNLRGGSWVFFKRRYLRIAPPLYAAFVLSVAILQLPRVRFGYACPQVMARRIGR